MGATALATALGVALALAAEAPAAPSAAAPSAAGPSAAARSAATTQRTATLRVPVGAEADGSPVTLDAQLTFPDGAGPHPAVLLAHGFGGTRGDLAAQARDLAGRGYVVVAYSARGFGSSGGRIHLNDPQFEVADARALVDLLAARPEVRQDSPGDPRVGVVGASYGGALALMLAGTDPRVDATAALITWHDLGAAFFPQAAVDRARPTTPAGSLPLASPERFTQGPFKQGWASRFFLWGAQGGPPRGGSEPARPTGAPCGRFDPVICASYRTAAETGTADPALLALLRRHSPAAVLDHVTAPTLLVQGMADSLFGLEHADATARALAARGTPVAVRWTDGGHDRPSSRPGSDEAAVRAWLDGYLRRDDSARPAEMPVPGFVYPTTPATARFGRGSVLRSLPAYPGLAGGSALAWAGLRLGPSPARQVLAPPGGQPASVTALPGLGILTDADLPTYPLAALPGQSAAFDTEPAAQRHTVIGSPRVRLRLRSSVAEPTLFVSLWRASGQVPSQPHRLVAPVRVPVPRDEAAEVTVALPAATYTVERGDVWRVLVTSTDAAYAPTRQARLDLVAVTGSTLELPTAAGRSVGVDEVRDTEAWGVAGVVAAVLAVVLGGALWRRRRLAATRATGGPFAGDAPPLLVAGLAKRFPDGHRAVDGIEFGAQRGQVVGLLGPNGAGKTTTIRLILGLLHADAGTVRVLGRPVWPGAPVLARVGALVEGPGFLPHLSGRQNLLACWDATGRARAEAHLEEAIEVAALGDALERPVRSYSHGMRQRLGIAQAMLGLPEVLVLDEPTNGLDPPQIAAMRPILRRYAAAGRTVLVSSHLLAEVEQTCSHVVVMHAGRVIASGAVADLLESADTTVAELDPATATEDAEDLAASLRATPGVISVFVEAGPRVVVVATLPRADVVRRLVALGAAVTGVTGRRHLEEVFLGAIAAARDGRAAGDGRARQTLADRLRQVRPR